MRKASNEVTTPEGRTVTIEQLANARYAIETIAANNWQMLEYHYNTCREDVEALCSLAQMQWVQMSRKGR